MLLERELPKARFRSAAMRRARRRGQRGELLIESLFTVAILGIIGTAALTALSTLLVSALLNQRIVSAGTAAAEFAEALERVPYVACATTDSYRASIPANAPVTDAIAALSGKYNLEIVSMKYLQSSAPGATTAAFAASCPGTDQGAQQIEVVVTSTSTESHTRGRTRLVFTKRDARCPADAIRPAEVKDGQPC